MKNQLLNLKMIALMCLMMVLGGGANVWAEDVTLLTADYANEWKDGSSKSISKTVSGVTFSFDGSNSQTNPKYYDDGLRLYEKCKVSISSDDDITKIVFTYTIKNNGVLKDVNIGSWNSSKKTWTGSAKSVSLTVGHSSGSSGQVRLTKIVVTKTQSKTLTSLAISGEPTKKIYDLGEALDPAGLVVTGTYDDKSTATITDGITWAMNPKTLSLSDVACSVTATVGGVTSPAYNVTGLTVNKAKLPATITLTGNATTLGIDEPNTFTVDHDGDGTLSATASAEGVVDLALVGNTVTVTPKAVGSVDITVAATEGTEYKAASKTYTVNVVPVGIAAIRNSITSISSNNKDAFTAVKLKDAVVTYSGKTSATADNNTIYVEDKTAGIVLYVAGLNYEPGDVLNGVISGKGYISQGLTQVTSIDNVSDITVVKGGEIPCTEITLAELTNNMEKWESRRVKVVNTTLTSVIEKRNAVISQDGKSITVFEKYAGCSGDKLATANVTFASIVGYPLAFKQRTTSPIVNELCVWEESDIVVATAEPTYTKQTLTFIAKDGADYYATFSSDKVTFITSKHVIPNVVTVANGKVDMKSEMFKSEKTTIESAEVDGYYIPANTGILLYSDAENVDYYTVENKTVDAISPVDNMLEPAPKDGGNFAFNEGYKYYKLAYNNYKEKTGLGFYWGANNGGAFYVKGGTAYLKVLAAKTAGAKGFTLNGEATGIEGVNANVENAKAIYNLNGQRVASMAKPGLYIVNGKKVVRK